MAINGANNVNDTSSRSLWPPQDQFNLPDETLRAFITEPTVTDSQKQRAEKILAMRLVLNGPEGE